MLALELLHHSRNKVPASHAVDLPRSEIIQNLSNLVSSIGYVVRPTNGNYGICEQAKKMLQVILDAVLSPEQHDQAEEMEHSSEPVGALDNFAEEALDDQMWLSNNLDMDFWTSLEDHPLLVWPEMSENS